MQFFRPPGSNNPAHAPSTAAVHQHAVLARPSFGAARAQALQQRLDSSIKERRQLAVAQQAAPQPVNEFLAQKGKLVEQRIANLQQQTKQIE